MDDDAFLISLANAMQKTDCNEGGASTLKPEGFGKEDILRFKEVYQNSPLSNQRQLSHPLDSIATELADHPRFEGFEVVGRGGMGIVFSAFDKETQEKISLKSLADNSLSTETLKSEFRILSNLRHPNLVSFKELHVYKGRSFFTMEYVEGENFHTYFRKMRDRSAGEWKKKDISDICEMFAQLATGLRFLHQSNFVHRDIKPSNVLVTPSGRVVLLDFGLAGFFHPQKPQAIGGTLDYMPLEQASEKYVRPVSDWFAFGVMLFEVLCGKRPFNGNNFEVLIAKLVGNVEIPSSSKAHIPQKLRNLAISLLNVSPEKRPLSDVTLSVLEECAGSFKNRLLKKDDRKMPFLGRQSSLESLSNALVKLKNARETKVCLIEGESGVGKTRLISEFMEQCRSDQNILILKGQCYEQERIPYKAIDVLMNEVATECKRAKLFEKSTRAKTHLGSLQKLFPCFQALPSTSDPAPNSDDDRSAAITDLRNILSILSNKRQLILIIDDVQWADLDSAALLSESIAGIPLLLICAHRPMQNTNRFVLQIIDAAQSTIDKVTVHPLKDLHAEQLLQEMFPSIDKRSVESTVGAAKGIPLLLSAIGRRAVLTDVDSTGDQNEIAKLTDIVCLNWEEDLEPNAKRFLQIICTAGKPMPQEIARRLWGTRKHFDEILSTLFHEEYIRLVSSDSGVALIPYHDIVKQGVSARMKPSDRQSIHASIAETLESYGGVLPGKMAYHFKEAGNGNKASHYFCLAGELASNSMAFSEAVSAYTNALQSCSGPESRKYYLKEKLAKSRGDAGQASQAGDLYLELAHKSDAGNQFLQMAAYQYCVSGRTDDAFREFNELLKPWRFKLYQKPLPVVCCLLLERFYSKFCKRRSSVAKTTLGDLSDLLWNVAVALSIFDPIQAALFFRYSLRVAKQQNDEFRIMRVTIWQCTHEALFGASKTKYVDDVLSSTRNEFVENDFYLSGMHRLACGLSALAFGRWSNASRDCQAAADELNQNCSDARWEIGTAQVCELISLRLEGRFAEMIEGFFELRENPSMQGNSLDASNLLNFVGPYVFMALDQPQHALSMLKKATAMWPNDRIYTQHVTAWASEAILYLYLGEYEKAFEAFEANWPKVKKTGLLHVEYLRIYFWQLRGRCAAAVMNTNKSFNADKICKSAIRQLRKEPTQWAAPMADSIEACVAIQNGESQLAKSWLQSAEEGFSTVDMLMFKHTTAATLNNICNPDKILPHKSDEDWFAQEKIKNRDSMVRAYYPVNICSR